MKERIPQKTLQVSSKKADAILLSVAVIWGWGFIAGKIALETASPQWILFFRFSIAAICILALFFKQIKNADKACVRWGILIGLLQFAALFCSALCLAIYNHSKAIISCGHLCVVYTVCGENPLPQKDFAEKLYCLAPCSCGNCFFESSGQRGNTNRRLHNIGLRIAVFGSDCHSGKSSRKMRNHTDYLLSNACIGGLCRNCCVLHGNSERAFQHTFVDRDCLSGCY